MPPTEVPRSVGMQRSRMRFCPHESSWSEWFERESRRICSALKGIPRRIEHIGSTAVPDLPAKPIIDIAVIVSGPSDFERSVEPLRQLGYEYRGQHGDDPLRRYFVLDQDGRRIAQLHLWSNEAPAWREAVAFRDLLRNREDLRAAYSREKVRVAEEVGWDKSEYSIRKGPFIETLLRSEGVRVR